LLQAKHQGRIGTSKTKYTGSTVPPRSFRSFFCFALAECFFFRPRQEPVRRLTLMQCKSPAQTLFRLVARKPFPGRSAENENRTAVRHQFPFPWETEIDFNFVGLGPFMVCKWTKVAKYKFHQHSFLVYSCQTDTGTWTGRAVNHFILEHRSQGSLLTEKVPRSADFVSEKGISRVFEKCLDLQLPMPQNE